ncbi:MAG: DHH family phosphoesterase [Clostridiales bacterium]|nr:DHH family phosphoesterase [Clostridiales bacterium]
MTTYEQMTGFLLGCDNLLLTAHHDPDADCIGAMLGLYHLFGGERRGWIMALEDAVPPNLKYMPGVENILRPADITRRPKAMIFLDCGEPRRISNGWLDAYSGLPRYCIDHHASNNFAGELAVVERDASSTGEIVAALGEDAGLPFNIGAATCLYSAIVSDTGCFLYENTTPRALETAARLLRLGVDMEQVRIKLFESRSSSGIAVLQAAFRNMQFAADGAICYSFVRREEAVAAGATMADFHNIANYTLLKAGVKMGLFLEEYDGYVKVSLRSRQGLRMDKLAQTLGGGGHMRAAGCRLEGGLKDALPLVLEKALAIMQI